MQKFREVVKCIRCAGRGICAQQYPDAGTTERRIWTCRACGGDGQWKPSLKLPAGG